MYHNPRSQTEICQAQPQYIQISQKLTNLRITSVLFIGDSITNSLHTKVISQAANVEIRKVKAYSSVCDLEANVAKQAARFPNQNFTDVAQHEMERNQFDILMLQAGSVDISNLKTKDNPTNHFDYFHQQAVMSANNLFSVAVNCLNRQPNLQKVVIFKQIPRYDPAQADSLQLKPALSLIFNNTLADLWIRSPLKEKILN